ncbi:hypothetical protein ACED27_18790 [Vibrio sp. FF112]|uniref:hypothetical protein n=1 Tax=Vibrio sp. FF112 TaxID=3230008 RepID=UPI00352F5204
MNPVEIKKALRFELMKRIYEVTGGEESKQIQLDKIIDVDAATDQEFQDTINAIKYLFNEQLIKMTVLGGCPAAIFIRHKGVVEVEQALSEPEQKTEHFNPAVTITNNIGTMTNSSLQQATSNSSIEVSYQLSDGEQSKIDELIKQIRVELESVKSQLSTEQARDVEAQLLTVESQLKSSKPQKAILELSLSTLGDLTKGVVSSGLWSLIQSALEITA